MGTLSAADEFFNVKQLNMQKIESLLRCGSMYSCRSELDALLEEIRFDELSSLVLRMYVCTDIYISARSFSRELGISDSAFAEHFGEADDIEKMISTIDGTKELLYNLVEQCISWRIKASRCSSGSVVKNAQRYIESNYMRDDISLNSIAYEVGLSPSYFSSLFKKETGRCLSDFLNEVRINRSKQLLCCTSKMIYEIAFEVGFQDYRYFSQIFKKFTGQTPRQFQTSANLSSKAV